jgi:hypothetical protein
MNSFKISFIAHMANRDAVKEYIVEIALKLEQLCRAHIVMLIRWPDRGSSVSTN